MLKYTLERTNADQEHPSEKKFDKKSKDDDGEYIERPIYKNIDGEFTLHNWKNKYKRVRIYPKHGEDADDYASKKGAKGDATDKYDKFDKYDHFPSAEVLKKAKQGSAADHYDKPPSDDDEEDQKPAATKPKWPAYKKEKIRVKKFDHGERKPRFVDDEPEEEEIRPVRKSHEQRARAAIEGLLKGKNKVIVPAVEEEEDDFAPPEQKEVRYLD